MSGEINSPIEDQALKASDSNSSAKLLNEAYFDPSEFGPVAKELFPKVDLNNDGGLSKLEIDTASADGNIQGREAAVLATLSAKYDRFFPLSLFGEKDGSGLITLDDTQVAGERLQTVGQFFVDTKEYQEGLAQFASDVNKRNAAMQSGVEAGVDDLSPVSTDFITGTSWLKPAALVVFGELDKDADGFIAWDEVEKFDTTKTDPDKLQRGRLVRHLEQNWGAIESASNDELFMENNGITKADLEAYHKNYRGSSPSTLNEIATSLQYFDSRISNSKDQLFATGQASLESIVPQAVDQGGVPDCYFLGPLASLAASEAGKRKILDMINVNEDQVSGKKTYTVTFPSDPAHPVTVDAPTDTELARFAGDSRYGFWAPLMEKAFGAYQARQSGKDYALPQLAIAPGTLLPNVGSVFSAGKSHVSNPRNYSELGLAETIEQALDDGNFVTLSSYETMTVDGKRVPSNYSVAKLGLPTNHVFGVVDYDRDTDELTLYNPWGNGEPTAKEFRDGTDDGLFKLPLSVVNSSFDGMAIGTDS